MDANRFDEATRILSRTDSRRLALKGLAGAALGGALGVRLGQPAAAARRCGSCSSHDDCDRGRCRSDSDGVKGCCSGFWSRGDCYNPKPKHKNWSYRWSDGKLTYYNRKTKKFRIAKLICSPFLI